MKAISFVVRTSAGNSQVNSIPADKNVYVIDAGVNQEISLNLRQSEIRGYTREGSNLEILLADGRVIILEGYFGADGDAASRLFISADGYLNEVSMIEAADGSVYAQYGPTEQWSKWSASDDLIFADGSDLAVADGGEDVTMLGAGLLGGNALLGALGVGGAGLVAAAAMSGGDDGGGVIPPVVDDGGDDTGGGDDSGIDPAVNEQGPIIIGGDDVDPNTETITITGVAEPGSEICVDIGGIQIITTATPEGTWAVVFEGDNFPDDGNYQVAVLVKEPDGTEVPLDGPEIIIDTTPPDLAFAPTTVATDDLVNLEEYNEGVSVTGTGEVGASIAVTIEGVTHTTIVDSNGNWSVLYPAGELPTGEYDTVVSVVSSDSYGNTSTITENIRVDTIPHPITINASTVEGDGVVNFVEASDGVTITGTSTAGATITVVVEGLTETTTVANDGTWSVTYAAGALPGGEYDATITASTVDDAGNPSSTTETIRIDTEVTNFTKTGEVDDGGVINNALATSGFDITGTVEVGSTVMVTVDGVTRQAVVDSEGNWTANFVQGDIASGERMASMTVDVTDPAGNTATLNETVEIDTRVNKLSQLGPIEGDDIVNAVEASDGVPVSGKVEPGSTVTLTVFGETHNAVVDAAGNWSVTIPAGSIPADELTADMVIFATDSAGNTASITEQLTIDTVVPDDPDVVGYFRETGGYRSVTTEMTDEDVTIHQVDGSGNVNELSVHASDDAFLGETDYHFLDGAGAPTTIPDGSELIITNADDAGNASSTFMVLDETAGNVVDAANPNLSGFNIDEIDLRFGDNSELTLTEAQIKALSENSDQVVVRGGADDTVTISGATAAGTTQIEGETFNVYTLGTDATVMIDDQVNVVI